MVVGRGGGDREIGDKVCGLCGGGGERERDETRIII